MKKLIDKLKELRDSLLNGIGDMIDGIGDMIVPPAKIPVPVPVRNGRPRKHR